MENPIELREYLEKLDNAYYNEDNPLVSDEEYDALREKYKELTGEYHDKDYVPGEAVKSRIPHETKILSLDKAQIGDVDDLRKRIKELLPVIIEPKFDGLTVVRYPNIALTRGNGELGEDVTEKCMVVPGFKSLKPTTYPLRMEVLMLRSEFKRINEERIAKGLTPYENCRNTAAGMLRRDDVETVQGLKAFIYDEIGSLASHSKVLEKLEKLYPGMITPYKRFTDVDSAIEYIQNFNREELDYDIDGLVVKSDQPNSMIKFGVTGHHPKNAFAVKFEAKGEWTEILDIEWQVGRNNITPVAILKPVKIDGSTISRCTLHNFANMHAIGLNHILYDNYHRTKVYVIKANDVIPRITKVKNWVDPEWVKLKGYESEEVALMDAYGSILLAPSACPECGVGTEFSNDILKCVNPECRGKLLNRITHMASRDALDIVGLSEETAKKIMDTYPEIIHPAEVLALTEEQILELPGFAKKSASNLYNAIQKSRTATIDKVIYAAGMPLIGKSVSKDICSCFDTEQLVTLVVNKTISALKDIDGVGEEIAKSFIDNWYMVIPFGDYMNDILEMPKKEVKKVDKKLSICVTGSFEGVNREHFQKLIEDAGHKFAKSVSKKTDFLLAGQKAGSKLAKANELGIPVITTEEELLEII